jgi:hypothetical protein
MVFVFYCKLQYYVPDTIRYCITLPYSMLFFLFFFVFCTIHKHKMWGDIYCIGMLSYGGRGDVGMK